MILSSSLIWFLVGVAFLIAEIALSGFILIFFSKRSQSKIFGHVYADTSIRTRIRAFLKQRKIPLAIVAPGSLVNHIIRSSRVACSDQGSGLNVAIRPG